ncbi:hypothetical protein [Halobacteriovorax sp.]|uniref:hypothetical protein n=1 Tax=Halobacteriovorax sp. TaxID=2020862 RepID=UPI003AF24950
MKKIFVILLGLLSINSLASEIKSLKYVSPWNYQMPAVEVLNNSTEHIEIIIKGALLQYPDFGFNFELSDRLTDVFELNNLNALIVKFPKSACKAEMAKDHLNIQLISCKNVLTFNQQDYSDQSQRMTQVKGAVVGFDGNIIEESDLVFNGFLSFHIKEVTERTVGRELNMIQAQVNGTIPFAGPDRRSLRVDLQKSQLALGPNNGL